MQKSTHYWAIFEHKTPVFEGSFSDCWQELVKRYSSMTLKALDGDGIRIARKA